MSQNVLMLLAEARELFSSLRKLKLKPSEEEGLLKEILADLSCIANNLSLLDGEICPEEKMVMAIFLRFPFLNNHEVNFIESWNLLDSSERENILGSVDRALQLSPKDLPERFNSLDSFILQAEKAGKFNLTQKYASRLFRFAVILAQLHNRKVNRNEIKALAGIRQKICSQLKSVTHSSDNSLISARVAGIDGEHAGLSSTEAALNVELEKLSKLIGLSSVKDEVHSLVNLLKLQLSREKAGLKSVDVSLHAVFSGPPGTGKTTVARIYAGILKSLNLLSQGTLLETDRAGLVAEFMGQTAAKTDKLVEQARGGVLFIDEAYSLSSAAGQGDYGKEAIEVILKRMEDYRSDFVVIVAGYSDEMEQFINSNPGLASRFSRKINFPDYKAEELEQIFLGFARDADYKLSSAAGKQLSLAIQRLLEQADRNFGNARTMRNLFEQALRNQANRLSKCSQLSRELLETLEDQDLEI